MSVRLTFRSRMVAVHFRADFQPPPVQFRLRRQLFLAGQLVGFEVNGLEFPCGQPTGLEFAFGAIRGNPRLIDRPFRVQHHLAGHDAALGLFEVVQIFPIGVQLGEGIDQFALLGAEFLAPNDGEQLAALDLVAAGEQLAVDSGDFAHFAKKAGMDCAQGCFDRHSTSPTSAAATGAGWPRVPAPPSTPSSRAFRPAGSGRCRLRVAIPSWPAALAERRRTAGAAA